MNIYTLLLSVMTTLKKYDILILIEMHHSMMMKLDYYLTLMEMQNGLMRYC